MHPKSSNDNSAYKSKMKLDLGKLNCQVQNVIVDFTKVNIKTLATQIGVLSECVKLYMELLTSKRYCALNDRTINLLMEGNIDTGATTSETAEGVKESDSEGIDLFNIEKEAGFFIIEKYERIWRCILSIFKQHNIRFV